MKRSSLVLKISLFFSLTALLVAGFWLTPRPTPAAPATTITVNTTADELNFDGDCSLREAIRAANTDATVDACPAGSGPDTINLPVGTINLTNTGSNDAGGDLDLTSNMTLQGAGIGFTEIHGQMGERILETSSGTEVTVKDVTLSGGQDLTGGAGGGVLSLGVFTLERGEVTGNTASSGGGMWNSGTTMTIIESTIANNTDNGNAGGAGLGGSPGTVTTLISSTVTENVTGHGAGGMNTFNGTFILINSTVSNNLNTSTSFGGAGISISGGEAELYLINSTVSGNVSTGAVGGGIFINSSATAHIFNSTIAYNSATSGGGIRNNGTVDFQNTIIAQNTATTVGGAPDCGGSELTSGGYNLIGEDAFCNLVGNSTGMIVDVDPLLGPLQENGGLSYTHALLANSPARNAGNPGGCTDQNGDTLTSDQRGFFRPVAGTCDLGAFESGQANTSVSIVESGDPVNIGEELIYTLTVHNAGIHSATGVELFNTFPENTLFVSVNPSQGICSEGAGVLTCSLGTIGEGADATVNLVLAPFSTGTATNHAFVSSNEIDSDSTNNVDTETTTIHPATDLTIIKTDTPDPAYTGAPITYQINVFTGPDAVSGMTMTDPLPATFDLDTVNSTAGSCSGTATITCNLGKLAANTVVTVTITGSTTVTDTLINTASVTGSPDANPNNNDSTAFTDVYLSADLAMSMTDTPDPVEIGSPLTYTLVITNHGPSDATGVSITDTLPPSLLSVDTEPSQGSCNNGTSVLTCDLGAIPSGDTAIVFIYVTTPMNYIGTISNSASVAGNEGDPDPDNNLASQNTDLIASDAVDLQITKTAGNSQATAGGLIKYTILVENLSETLQATNVNVIDYLPAEVTFVSATPSQGTCNPGPTCSLGNIPAEGSATITIIVQVKPEVPENTVITNRADVDGDDFDANPGNNFSTVDVTVVTGFSVYLPIIVR